MMFVCLGHSFVTRKISYGVARIALGDSSPIQLGNLNSRRDWGHARDYMNGVLSMMKNDQAGDYVLATGETRSAREFATAAFRVIGKHIR